MNCGAGRMFVLGCAVLFPGPGAAQSARTVQIAAGDVCEECDIGLELIATLTAPAESALFANLPTPSITRLSDGRFLVGTMVGTRPIAVFRSDGEWDHGVGGFGEGPGEFTGSRMFIREEEDGAVSVFQRVRRTVLEPDLQTTRSTTRLRSIAWEPTRLGGLTAVWGVVSALGGLATPVQLLDEEGDVVRGIGVLSDQPVQTRTRFPGLRHIAPARDGTRLWIAHWTRYEVSLFTLEGVEERRVTREVEWFKPYDSPRDGEGYNTPQRIQIGAVAELPRERLLVLLTEADRAYRPPAEAEEREIPIDPFLPDTNRLDTIIEVLDLSEGHVVSRIRRDEFLRLVSVPLDRLPLLYSLREGPDGALRADIWELRVGR